MATPHITDAGRIATLRERCFTRKHQKRQTGLAATARALRSSEGKGGWQLRRGLVVRERLANLRFDIDDLELLAGRLAPADETELVADERAQNYLAGFPPPGGQTGHCELDRTPVLTHGIDGTIARLRGLQKRADDDKAETYQSFIHALLGLSTMLGNAASAADRAGAGADVCDRRRLELAEIAASCGRIAHAPPESFRDALQLCWMTDLAVMYGDGVSLVVAGRLDRALWHYLQRDLTSGDMTTKRALVLLESLYLLTNEFIPDGLAMSVMVGGQDPEGEDATNPLSYLCFEALRRTGMIYPTVGLCWHEGTPEDLTQLAIELVADGYPTPAFFGDDTIQRGLGIYGVPQEQTCLYINSTCVEITPVGASNVWVASPYFSTCGILVEEIRAQAASECPAPTFEALLAAFQARLGEHIRAAAKQQGQLRERRRLRGRKPLQSVFTRSCIDRGRDIDDGGADYNWVECSFVGLANLADSLHVIRQEVYGSSGLAFADLEHILGRDYQDYEDIRSRFLAHDKYGTGHVDVDGLVGRVVEGARKACSTCQLDPDASPFVPGAFCWIMHERLGGECGATPDGRRAGVPFADGCGPAQGRDRLGPTTSILSCTNWDHSPLIGGAAYNMKFGKDLLVSEEARTLLRHLVVTFLRRGGFETQINVVDTAILREAKADPERHRDLVVRIGGYTDYFVRLSPEMQDELILRTQFDGLR